MTTATEIKPLSARSVVVSLLLGAHGDAMTARQVVAAGEHFGLAASTVRVALTRAVAADDLHRTGSTYRLGPRLLARRERLEQHGSRTAWDRTWEMVVVVVSGRSSAERAALRGALTDLRLAELREGVWLRPANLTRPLVVADPGVARVFGTTPAEDPAGLAAALWDLDGWAKEAEATRALLESTTDPAQRLAVAAHLVRHLAGDPLLPRELWPPGWPEPAARAASVAYEDEIRAITST